MSEWAMDIEKNVSTENQIVICMIRTFISIVCDIHQSILKECDQILIRIRSPTTQNRAHFCFLNECL